MNKIVFGLNATDAKAMAAMAPELTAEDFMMLPRYQVYTTLQCGGRATGWMRGQTLPPVDPVRLPADLKALSQNVTENLPPKWSRSTSTCLSEQQLRLQKRFNHP